MSVIADYANLYETEFRPRRKRLRYLGVLAVWVGLFVVRPRLALAIWREKLRGRQGIEQGSGGLTGSRNLSKRIYSPEHNLDFIEDISYPLGFVGDFVPEFPTRVLSR